MSTKIYDNGGEPNTSTYLGIIITLLALGLLYAVAEKGWIKTILDILEI